MWMGSISKQGSYYKGSDRLFHVHHKEESLVLSEYDIKTILEKMVIIGQSTIVGRQ